MFVFECRAYSIMGVQDCTKRRQLKYVFKMDEKLAYFGYSPSVPNSNMSMVLIKTVIPIYATPCIYQDY